MIDAPTILALCAGFSLLLSIIAFFSGRSKATKDETDTIHKRANLLSERITKLEEQIKHLPTNAQFVEFTSSMGKLHGDLRQMMGEFTALKNQVNNVDSFLRQRT